MDTFLIRQLGHSLTQVIGLSTDHTKPDGLVRIIGGDSLAHAMPCPRCSRSIRATMGRNGPEWICGCANPVGWQEV